MEPDEEREEAIQNAVNLCIQEMVEQLESRLGYSHSEIVDAIDNYTVNQ